MFRHAKALKVTCQLLGDRLQGMLGCSEAVVFLVQGQELIALNLDPDSEMQSKTISKSSNGEVGVTESDVQVLRVPVNRSIAEPSVLQQVVANTSFRDNGIENPIPEDKASTPLHHICCVPVILGETTESMKSGDEANGDHRVLSVLQIVNLYLRIIMIL